MKQPEPLAVALQYDGENTPVVSARGMGPIAEQIIEIAQQHGVPLQRDDELVEILAQLDTGAEIPENLYRAVAEVIAFAYILSGKFPRNWNRS